MRTRSKSDFKLARSCVTKLYFKELGYPQNSDDNPYLAMLGEGGYMVEQGMPRRRVPDAGEAGAGRSGRMLGRTRAAPELLLRYCKLDATATVLIWDHLRRGAGVA